MPVMSLSVHCTQLRKESMSLKISQQKLLKLKTERKMWRVEKWIEHPRHVGQYQVVKYLCNWNPQRRKKKQWGRRNNAQEFSKISDRHQTTCPRSSSSQHTQQAKYTDTCTSTHIHPKMYVINWKPKTENLEVSQKKQDITNRGTWIRMAADFSSVTGQAVRQWRDIFKVLKEKKKVNPEFLAKIFFKSSREIKGFQTNKNGGNSLLTGLLHEKH